jgi:hypothetical protein
MVAMATGISRDMVTISAVGLHVPLKQLPAACGRNVDARYQTATITVNTRYTLRDVDINIVNSFSAFVARGSRYPHTIWDKR